jgi:hypothetical protein
MERGKHGKQHAQTACIPLRSRTHNSLCFSRCTFTAIGVKRLIIRYDYPTQEKHPRWHQPTQTEWIVLHTGQSIGFITWLLLWKISLVMIRASCTNTWISCWVVPLPSCLAQFSHYVTQTWNIDCVITELFMLPRQYRIEAFQASWPNPSEASQLEYSLRELSKNAMSLNNCLGIFSFGADGERNDSLKSRHTNVVFLIKKISRKEYKILISPKKSSHHRSLYPHYWGATYLINAFVWLGVRSHNASTHRHPHWCIPGITTTCIIKHSITLDRVPRYASSAITDNRRAPISNAPRTNIFLEWEQRNIIS